MYDSEEDLEKGHISTSYAPSEIFCCSYAPYFWEAIKIRYPEYTEFQKNIKEESSVFIYVKKGDIMILPKNKKAAIYIRENPLSGISFLNYMKDKEELVGYCNKNEFYIIKEYVDNGFSGLSNTRPSLKQLINDLKNNEIDVIVTKDSSTLFRNPFDMLEFLNKDFMKGKKVYSLNNSIEKFMETIKNTNIRFTRRFEELEEENEM